MKQWLFCFCAITLFYSSIFAGHRTALTQSIQLKECLLKCYRIDPSTASVIVDKFSPLLENDEYAQVVDDFIEESNKLDIYQTIPTGPIRGNTLPYHVVLFENDYLRVSWAATQSGQQEPFQLHPWKTLMVIIQPSQFHSEIENGASYEDDWPIGVYLLDPSPDRFACKNIGPSEYHGLVFEIKTTCCNNSSL